MLLSFRYLILCHPTPNQTIVDLRFFLFPDFYSYSVWCKSENENLRMREFENENLRIKKSENGKSETNYNLVLSSGLILMSPIKPYYEGVR